MSDTATRDQLIAFILDRLSRRLSGAVAVDLDRDLIELGLKSVDAVLISGEIEDAFGLEVEPVLLFEARTVNRVADSVLRSAMPDGPRPAFPARLGPARSIRAPVERPC